MTTESETKRKREEEQEPNKKSKINKEEEEEEEKPGSFEVFDDDEIKRLNDASEPQKKRIGILFTDIPETMYPVLKQSDKEPCDWIHTRSEFCTLPSLYRMNVEGGEDIQEIIFSLPLEGCQIGYNFSDMTESKPESRLLCEKVYVIRSGYIDTKEKIDYEIYETNYSDKIEFVTSREQVPGFAIKDRFLSQMIDIALSEIEDDIDE